MKNGYRTGHDGIRDVYLEFRYKKAFSTTNLSPFEKLCIAKSTGFIHMVHQSAPLLSVGTLCI